MKIKLIKKQLLNNSMALRTLLSSEYVTGLVANNMETIDKMGRNLMGSIPSIATKSNIIMNMYEKDNKYNYELEIPGIERENIQLSQKDGFIKVCGKRMYRNGITKENYHTSESSYGTFERKFRLPMEAEPTTLDAKFRNGMLLITVDKIIETDETLTNIEIN
jgi:HSP20 family molecular chaperone IbpA